MCCVAGHTSALVLGLVLPTGTTARRPIGPPAMGSAWRRLRNYCLASLLLMCLKSIPEKGKIFWAMNVKNSPTLFSEGDEVEWARVTMVQGKPLSVILCESRESRNTFSQEWTPALRLFLKRGDDGEWAKVQGKLPIPSFSAKAGNPDRQSAKHGPTLCAFSSKEVTKVSGRG